MARRRTGGPSSKTRHKGIPLISFLQLIGRPFFWLLTYAVFILFWLTLTTGKISLFTGKLLGGQVRLLFSITGRRLAILVFSFFRLWKKLSKKILSLRPPRIIFVFPKIKISLKLVFLIVILSSFSLAAYYLIFNVLKDLPDPNRLLTRNQVFSTKIYDRHSTLLYKIYRTQNRTLVQLKDIPLHLIQATIAIEDAEFYNHHGISPKGIIRALQANLAGRKFEGGSTITQQLVKNTLLTPERTILRKIKEIILATIVERKFTKDEILQMYLNEVGYGGTTYGAEEAAQVYFGKSVRDLNLAEAALLAGLPASPTSFSPFGSHPERAKLRQELVLRRMVEENFITTEEAEKAKKQLLTFSPRRIDIKAPHFVMYIKDLLVEKYGEQMVEEGGLQVTTSLDLSIQEMAEEIVRNEVNKLTGFHITNGAALVTNPKTGEILAMVGSKDYFAKDIDGNVNVALALRQPGSAIKPVNYSIALENGFTAASILSDTPITYMVAGQSPYSPKNYDNRFHGEIPLRTALASSYNVPAVKILSAFGVEKMVERGRAMGITTWDDPSKFGLSLTLGSGEVKMVDMAVVYGTLANLGSRVDLKPILEVRDYRGKLLEKSPALPPKTPVLNPGIAFILNDILSDNSARSPAFGTNSLLNIADHPHVAVKTGTTQKMHDNWTIGYTPDYLVAVWVGNNDNTPMSYVASGVTGASPIWNKIMTNLIKDLPDKEFPLPDNIRRIEICSSVNTLPCEGCGGKWEYFLAGTEPKVPCQPIQSPASSPLPEKITIMENQNDQDGEKRKRKPPFEPRFNNLQIAVTD